MSGNTLVPREKEIVLKVVAQIAVQNKAMKNRELFDLEDKVTHLVLGEGAQSKDKWRVLIKSVGKGNNNEILIPASIDELDKTISPIEAMIKNPGGGNNNDFPDKGTEFVWSLYIPLPGGESITFSNAGTPSLSKFPTGDKAVGAKGNLELQKWTFAEGIESLPGVLTVKCKANGIPSQAERVVNCVLNRSTPEIDTGGHELRIITTEAKELNINQPGVNRTFTYALYKDGEQVWDVSKFEFGVKIKWKDTQSNVTGLKISNQTAQNCTIVIDPDKKEQLIQEIGLDKRRIAIANVICTSKDGRYQTVSRDIEIEVYVG